MAQLPDYLTPAEAMPVVMFLRKREDQRHRHQLMTVIASRYCHCVELALEGIECQLRRELLGP
jgi:hypothetical protein